MSFQGTNLKDTLAFAYSISISWMVRLKKPKSDKPVESKKEKTEMSKLKMMMIAMRNHKQQGHWTWVSLNCDIG